MEIKKCTSTHNTGSRNGAAIKYLVIHYTGSTHSEKGTARDCCKMFATSSREASADFVVDDEEIYQYNGDIKNRKCWAVGGKKYRWIDTSVGGTYYGKCTNANSISIEMKSSKVNRKSVKDTDTDWYLTDKVVANTVELAAYLLKKYNIPFNNMIMHHHVSGKLCPLPWCQKESDLSKWEDFKKRVKAKLNGKKKDDDVKTVTKVDKDSKRSKKEVVKALQTALNKDYGCGLAVDGDYGAKSKSSLQSHNIKKGSKSNSVKFIQTVCNELGFYGKDKKKLSVDGAWGTNTDFAVKSLQKSLGTSQDAIIGTGTMSKILAKYK